MPRDSQSSSHGSFDDGLSVGQRADLVVSGLSHDGRGVVPVANTVAFVDGVLPGEEVRVRLTHRSRRHWHGELEVLLRASEDRQKPACFLADRCGGCNMQHVVLAAQRRWKRQQLIDALQRIGHLGDLEALVAPTLSQGDGIGYRNRAILPLERRADGLLRAGYYKTGSHTIVNLSRCPVLDPRLDGLITPIKADLAASAWPVDRHLTVGGGLRHLALRIGHHSGEILITLVSSHDQLPGLDAMAERWLERWPAVVGVCLNLQDQPTNVLMGTQTTCLAGRGWLREVFAGLSYTIRPDTFFQVNTPLAEQVVPLMRQSLLDQEPELLIDAYCGIGTYGLPLAQSGWQVHGLELGTGSVQLARENARINRVDHLCRFSAGPVARLLGECIEGCHALLVDPPRKGLEPAVVSTILGRPPHTLLYLSCNPATLARDLAQLVGPGAPYRLVQIQPLDFFPQTSHVETLVSLRRQ